MSDNLVTFPAERSHGGKLPRIPGAISNRRLWIRTTPAERDALDQVARENGLTRTELIRLAVNSLVEDYRDGDYVFAVPIRRKRDAA